MIYKGIEIPDSLKDKVIDHIVEECTDQFIDILTDVYLHDYRDWLKEGNKKVVCKVFTRIFPWWELTTPHHSYGLVSSE